ncbi:MAG: hypothetical protein JNN31_09670 [Dechloromonas sp.]|nr:hypothetical protein [Dechloromonas sp.]
MKPAFKTRLAVFLLASLWASMAWSYDPLNRKDYLAKIKQAEALYKDKCEKVAGIKIYKTVPDVEGVLLVKIRPNRTDRELADPNWPGAAFGREARGDGYIASFLGSEVPTQGPIDAKHRGQISNNFPPAPNSLPGYRWVEVPDPKDGLRYRYTGSVKVVGQKDPTAYNVQLSLKKDPNYDMNVYRWSLDKVPSPSKTPPRYAVTFEDHVIPEERDLWVASSTVKVLDLKTNEVLGEMTRYAINYIHAPHHSMPWLNHSECPLMYATGDSDSSRHLVDQILIPKKDK